MLGNLVTLVDKDANRQAILDQLAFLKERANSGDFLVVYWTGNSVYDLRSDDVELIPADASSAEEGSTISLAKDIIPISSERNPLLFIGDGCNVGDGLVGRFSREYPHFAVLTSAKADEAAIDVSSSDTVSPFARAVSQAILGEATDIDGDGFISAEEIFVFLYPRVASKYDRFFRQHPSIAGRHAHRIFLQKALEKEGGSHFIMEDSVIESLVSDNASTNEINGQVVDSLRIDRNNKSLFLSEKESSILQQGLNLLRTGKQEFVIWREKDKLRKFAQPYLKSRAIIIAIDDYGRVRDSARRGPTGLQPLKDMVKKANELVATLTQLGFDKADIITLFNEQASSSAIEAELKNFWEGGKYAKTDRLLFYFGGHGVVRDGKGLLATYDYQPNQVTLTTFHLADLTGRHSALIAAHHMLSLLDACYSGLATPFGLDEGARPPQQKTEADFGVLTLIEGDVSRKARNLLLAGTDDDRALYINGGIFTEALIKALGGSADRDRNGIIQFDELTLEVSNQVQIRARQTGVIQTPSSQVLDVYGKGKVLFLLPGLTRHD
jgi:hypothetical protein